MQITGISVSSQTNNNVISDDDRLQLLKIKNEESSIWLRKTLKKNYIKLINFLIIILLILILEFIYRIRLFDYSIKLIKK